MKETHDKTWHPATDRHGGRCGRIQSDDRRCETCAFAPGRAVARAEHKHHGKAVMMQPKKEETSGLSATEIQVRVEFLELTIAGRTAGASRGFGK